jgi:hypothetical protein
LLIAATLAQGVPTSIGCAAEVPSTNSWQVDSVEPFAMSVPPGYKYQPIQVTSGALGKWVRRTGQRQSAIVFSVGPRGTFMREYEVAACTQSIHGEQARVATGIGPTGRYLVRAEWLKPLGGRKGSYLVVWADTANPTEQAEALAAIRTVALRGIKDGA